MRTTNEIITSILDQHRTGLVSNLGGALAELVWISRHTSEGKLMGQFKLPGQVKSGKNHMQITRTGQHYPLPEWAAWRDRMVWEIRAQGPWRAMSEPLVVHVDYAGVDLKRRDVPGMEDALFHCMERAGVVKDDSLFKECHWWHSLDRENPRVQVRLYALGQETEAPVI